LKNEILENVENCNEKQFHYISAPSGLFAILTKETGQTDKLQYIHTDHLGSIQTISNESGQIDATYSYDAWGRQRDATNWFLYYTTPLQAFNRGYTGHEHLSDFGLINLNGRLYDPVLGRMLSPDNYVQMAGNSQNYNRYSYCFNNPLIYTDPSGEWIWIPAVIIGAYLGGTTANDGELNPGKWNYSDPATYGGMIIGGVAGYAGAVVGAAAGTSALAGGATTVEAGIAAGMMGGTVSGAINVGGMTALAGGSFNDVIGGMTLGAVMGGFAGATSGGVGAAIGDFSGVAGSGLKNAMFEIGHSTIKGAATGLSTGGVMAVMNQDASYLWKGAAFGAGFGASIAAFKIAAFGPFSPSMSSNFMNLEVHGQYYRKGWFKGAGITLGKTISLRFTGNSDIDNYLIRHDIGHVADIKKVGLCAFYRQTFKQYIQFGIKGSHYYKNTFEWRADQYVINKGYYTPYTFLH